jgi:hypothetical protein
MTSNKRKRPTCLFFPSGASLTTSMRFVALLTLGLLLFSGCGERLSVAPVSGTITFEGKPLARASITTQPIATGSTNPGPGSFGRTDDQGRFELELVKPAKKGAIIGEHRVMISPAEGATPRTQRHQSEEGQIEVWVDDPRANRQAVDNTWPARLTDGSLLLQVPPDGTNEANFDLTVAP